MYRPSIQKNLRKLTGILGFNRKFYWQVSTGKFIVITTLVNMIIYHMPLYTFTLVNLDYWSLYGVLTFITLLVIIFMSTTTILFLLVILTQHLLKPVLILIALGNSIALYFVSTYQIILDRSMMGNVFNTNFVEATSYLHPKLFIYCFVFGILPSWLLLKTRIQYTTRFRLIPPVFAIIIVCLGWIYFVSSTWLWFDQNSKKLGGAIMPWSYVVNAIRHHAVQLKVSQKQTLLPPATFSGNEKTVVILVIGESARAQNFSLYGYDKPTNPLLAQSDVIALNNAIACATYTTASINCMLSHTDTSSGFYHQYETLPSYLQRHGIDVIWRTNNWGEPPMNVQDFHRGSDLRGTCEGSGCGYDEVLLSGLAKRIQSSKRQKIFVVLHQTGSHGPSYYTKYPKQFETFKPTCKSVELHKCTNQELINAYDNTILYTDYFLSETIHLLEKLKETSTMLMYVSDHGESLGEYGLYLHGTPFSIAPDVQKKVPFIIWMSDKFIAQKGLSNATFPRKNNHTHKNIFHSIMTAFDMHSEVYNEQFDIFK